MTPRLKPVATSTKLVYVITWGSDVSLVYGIQEGLRASPWSALVAVVFFLSISIPWLVAVVSARVIQFSTSSPVGVPPPPETGEGWGGGEALGGQHTPLLSPHPSLPPHWGEGVKAS